jgi:serine/threonine protein phosphatase PrpC
VRLVPGNADAWARMPSRWYRRGARSEPEALLLGRRDGKADRTDGQRPNRPAEGPVPVVTVSGVPGGEAAMDVGGRSDVGLVRQRNEDALLVDQQRRVFAVADGLGGHPAGDVASRIAIETIRGELAAVPHDAEVEKALAEALHRAHDAVWHDAEQDRSHRGMGTTAVLAHLSAAEDTAWVAHVGDSRAYLSRDGQVDQLTRDHTSGGLYFRGHITQALGSPGGVAPDTGRVELRPGDRLLLCTDGLTDMLTDPEIAGILDQGAGAEETCDRLVGAAKQRGGTDNVTVIVVAAGG